MRILLAHNYYGSAAPSGENIAFEAEAKLLASRGQEVKKFLRYSDDLLKKGPFGAVIGALSTPWSFSSARAIKPIIQNFRPDILHAHNTFPLLSPSIFHAAKNRTARVLTLHNYRLFCASAMLLRDGEICTQCLDKGAVKPALRYGCYRNSHLATVPMALNINLQRHLNTWVQHVDAFIALSKFQKEMVIAAGLPREKVHVKPNFNSGNPAVVPWDSREEKVVFVGRLSKEKGIKTLLKAWETWGSSAPELRIIGDGPMMVELKRYASNLNVTFLGKQPHDQVLKELARAKLLAFPSECYETFGLALVEAFSVGTPVVASKLGALPSTVKDGVTGILFTPKDSEDLVKKIKSAWEAKECLEKLGRQARAAFDNFYNEEFNYQALIEIYDRAIFSNRCRP